MHRNIMTYGTFEAKLAEILTGFEKELPENIKLAYLPSSGVIKLRLTGRGKDRPGLQELMSGQVASLYKIIPEYIYGENEDSLEKVAGRGSSQRKKSNSLQCRELHRRRNCSSYYSYPGMFRLL